MQTEAQREHQWLYKFVGEWTYESEMNMGPDAPPAKATGAESVRKLGELWVLCEASGEMPGGEPMTSLMTLGYDPQKKRFTGTWVGSMMSWLWVYDGSLDAEQRVLALESEGPDWNVEGKLATYRDTIEWKSDEHRTLTSQVRGDDGTWGAPFMTTHYRRRKS